MFVGDLLADKYTLGAQVRNVHVEFGQKKVLNSVCVCGNERKSSPVQMCGLLKVFG